MDKTTAPKVPSPKRVSNKPETGVFFMLALDMSWRLAIVVLVPIIVGFKLDERLKIAPVLTVLGFILAMVGTAMVLKRTVAEANRESNK